MHAGGKGWIQRELGRLEMWVCANLMKLNKAKHKVLHRANRNPKHRLRGEWGESRKIWEHWNCIIFKDLPIQPFCDFMKRLQDYLGHTGRMWEVYQLFSGRTQHLPPPHQILMALTPSPHLAFVRSLLFFRGSRAGQKCPCSPHTKLSTPKIWFLDPTWT